MKIKDLVFKEFVKNGYAESNGNRVWNIAQRKFLYLTPELAKGFLNLRNFDRYRKIVVEKEINLIKSNARRIAEDIGDESFNLIDMFCGDGTKAKEFFKALNGKAKVRYCPVNVSKYLVNLSLKNVKKEKFENVKDYKPYFFNGDAKLFEQFLVTVRGSKYQRNVILILGSVLASYDINDFLYRLSNIMLQGDYVVIGNGVRRGKRLVSLETYKHNIFDQWFIHLMRGVGFKDKEIKYDARFGNSRVEMFYKIQCEKKIKHKGKEIKLNKGDEVLVATLYKYYAKELNKFCKMYFKEVDLVKDSDGEYALVICRK
ncbi:MAG: L-histidine N(alpha)-methyltransferase [Nanoarchaeota archaeon]|nr:L-histidine N(alpha)-methyltransferase [Nanoarchaeota archaeon]